MLEREINDIIFGKFEDKWLSGLIYVRRMVTLGSLGEVDGGGIDRWNSDLSWAFSLIRKGDELNSKRKVEVVGVREILEFIFDLFFYLSNNL